MSILSAKTLKKIALTCLAVVVVVPLLLALLVWGVFRFKDLTNPYRYEYPEHLETDDLRETYEQFDPNLIYLTTYDTVNRGVGLEGYSGAYYRYAALPDTDTAEYMAMYEVKYLICSEYVPQIVRAAGSDTHPILNGTVTAELYLRTKENYDTWYSSELDERHLYGQLIYDSQVTTLNDTALLDEILTVVATRARMEEATYKKIRGDMLDMPPEEVPDFDKVVNPDGSTTHYEYTWGYEPVTDSQGRPLYLRLSVAEHPNIVWDAAIYVNAEGVYALRRRVYVRSSAAIDHPYAFRSDEYELYYPLSVSLDTCLPDGWDTAAPSDADTTP